MFRIWATLLCHGELNLFCECLGYGELEYTLPLGSLAIQHLLLKCAQPTAANVLFSRLRRVRRTTTIFGVIRA